MLSREEYLAKREANTIVKTLEQQQREFDDMYRPGADLIEPLFIEAVNAGRHGVDLVSVMRSGKILNLMFSVSVLNKKYPEYKLRLSDYGYYMGIE